jgi:hypothetical protein
MRMSAHRTPYARVTFGYRPHPVELVEPRADRQHRADSGCKSTADHGIALWCEIGKIEMAMAIDQHGGFDFQCSFRWVECLSFAANTANQQQTSVPY